MENECYACRTLQKIAEINEENDLEISLDKIAEIYGHNVVAKMADNLWNTVMCIEYLIFLDFGEDVSDICNRYGILLCYDSESFCDKVWELVRSMGDNYVEKMGEDMSCWGSLM